MMRVANRCLLLQAAVADTADELFMLIVIINK